MDLLQAYSSDKESDRDAPPSSEPTAKPQLLRKSVVAAPPVEAIVEVRAPMRSCVIAMPNSRFRFNRAVPASAGCGQQRVPGDHAQLDSAGNVGACLGAAPPPYAQPCMHPL